ncbi:MAG: oxidoreductase [Sphingomonas bacterium]|nr:oxidoreductase [Sphingomonas bacterium]MDB5682850.1 oxidoreductase [Sphingomonas bacterium]MDB5718333.1 oxidoreductase [Sphingomonas bacterium]
MALSAQDTNHGLNLSSWPVLPSGEAALASARALLGDVAAADQPSEADRRLRDTLVEKMRASGLFGLVMPRNLGGSGLGFADLVRVTAEIGATSGSAAWVFGVLAGHSWLINLFPEQAQREIMDDPTTLIATVFRMGGTVVPEGEGYRLTGATGRFCSGIDFATWVIIGNAVKLPDGRVEPRFFVVPKTEIEVIDDWNTLGMRATGSRSIRIADTFIPGHRSCSLADMLAGTTPGAQMHEGAIFRMPFAQLAPFSIVGAPLGMARGLIKSFADELGAKLATAEPLEVAEQSATLARLAECAAEVDAALALVISDAEMIDRARDPAEISALQRQQIPRNWAWAVQKARHAANRIFEVAGGSAIYDGHPMQRMFRDVNSSAQHFAFTWDRAMTAYGRELAGLKPGVVTMPKRA